MKKESNAIYGFVCVLGIFLSRFLFERYGNDGRSIIVILAGVFYICYLFISIYKRKTEEVIKGTAALIPIILMVTGIIIEKLYISIIGAVLLFTITPLIIKKFNRN